MRLTRYQGCDHLEQPIDWTAPPAIALPTQSTRTRKASALFAQSSFSFIFFGSAPTGKAKSRTCLMSGRTEFTRTLNLRFGIGVSLGSHSENVMEDRPPSKAQASGNSCCHATLIMDMLAVWTSLQRVWTGDTSNTSSPLASLRLPPKNASHPSLAYVRARPPKTRARKRLNTRVEKD